MPYWTIRNTRGEWAWCGMRTIVAMNMMIVLFKPFNNPFTYLQGYSNPSFKAHLYGYERQLKELEFLLIQYLVQCKSLIFCACDQHYIEIHIYQIQRIHVKLHSMSAFFSFDSMIIVALLLICTASYIRGIWPNFIQTHKRGFRGMLRSAAVIGDRLSPLVAVACLAMAGFNLTR